MPGVWVILPPVVWTLAGRFVTFCCVFARPWSSTAHPQKQLTWVDNDRHRHRHRRGKSSAGVVCGRYIIWGFFSGALWREPPRTRLLLASRGISTYQKPTFTPAAGACPPAAVESARLPQAGACRRQAPVSPGGGAACQPQAMQPAPPIWQALIESHHFDIAVEP